MITAFFMVLMFSRDNLFTPRQCERLARTHNVINLFYLLKTHKSQLFFKVIVCFSAQLYGHEPEASRQRLNLFLLVPAGGNQNKKSCNRCYDYSFFVVLNVLQRQPFYPALVRASRSYPLRHFRESGLSKVIELYLKVLHLFQQQLPAYFLMFSPH